MKNLLHNRMSGLFVVVSYLICIGAVYIESRTTHGILWGSLGMMLLAFALFLYEICRENSFIVRWASRKELTAEEMLESRRIPKKM